MVISGDGIQSQDSETKLSICCYESYSQSWPIEGWNDPVANSWKDEDGNTQWFGFFGRGIFNADQESFFESDDQWDDEFNATFNPDSNDVTRKGMGLRMRQRGFQWASFLAEDAIFWLYEINNDGTTAYRKADFGTVVGTLAGGDGDSQDDLGFFDIKDWITYSWDSDGIGNKGQKVGYVGYAFLDLLVIRLMELIMMMILSHLHPGFRHRILMQ